MMIGTEPFALGPEARRVQGPGLCDVSVAPRRVANPVHWAQRPGAELDSGWREARADGPEAQVPRGGERPVTARVLADPADRGGPDAVAPAPKVSPDCPPCTHAPVPKEPRPLSLVARSA